jgi:secondary thiamine-phosphate synthase enzyme
MEVRTRKQVEFINITRDLESHLGQSGVQEGVCHLYVPHTTAGITINEGADPSVVKDIIETLDALVPESEEYHHGEGNSPAHIKSTLVGQSVTVLVDGGRLVLGTWQKIFFCEFDGPRTRNVFLKIEKTS